MIEYKGMVFVDEIHPSNWAMSLPKNISLGFSQLILFCSDIIQPRIQQGS